MDMLAAVSLIPKVITALENAAFSWNIDHVL
jgi:hypothetical protein